jgi:hypothetical protein
MIERLEQNNSLGENSDDGRRPRLHVVSLPLWASVQSLVNQDRRSGSLHSSSWLIYNLSMFSSPRFE